MFDQGGYQKVTGRTTPTPPENLAWFLARTIEALLCSDGSQSRCRRSAIFRNGMG